MAYLAGSLFGAGSDTTAVAIMYVVMASACYPKAQEKVQEQLDIVVGRDRGMSMLILVNESQPGRYSSNIRRLQFPPADRGIHVGVSSLEACYNSWICSLCISRYCLCTLSHFLT